MIQRIQSIFLLLSGLSFFGLFGLDFLTNDKNTSIPLLQDHVFDINDHTGLLILTGLGGALALINIFLFKNRALQINISRLVSLLSLALLALAVFLAYSSHLFDIQGNHFGIGGALPLLGLVFALLAAKYIRKDDKLVKSMDRLRD